MADDFAYSEAELVAPTLQAIRALGGSANVDEIEEQVARLLKLTDAQINAVHRGSTTKLAYRLAWVRNRLKRAGILENSARGIWALTPKGQGVKDVDGKEIQKIVDGQRPKSRDLTPDDDDDEPIETDELTWQEEVIQILQGLDPDKFERFCQRMLRELGFTEVQVTGRTGDGGIDGKGLVKVGGVLAFHVVFQCKRFKGSVSASHIRDFRGAMVGRADKGLFLTTGTFTRDAKREAQRDGAPPIDLLDGLQIAEQMKVLKLGVQVAMVERVGVMEQWFREF